MIVLDASVVLEVLLRIPAGRRPEPRLFRSEESWHGPELLDLEVTQVLRRYQRRDQITEPRAEEALADLASLPLHRYSHAPLLPRIWQLRHDFTAYDAAYIALAEALDTPLLTRDSRLAAAPGVAMLVEVV